MGFLKQIAVLNNGEKWAVIPERTTKGSTSNLLHHF
jgi:hypothetical protein